MTGSEPDTAIPDCFGGHRALIDMIHVGALPGSPASRESMDAIVGPAVAEARVYCDAGFSAAAIENMHDRPVAPLQSSGRIRARLAVTLVADSRS